VRIESCKLTEHDTDSDPRSCREGRGATHRACFTKSGNEDEGTD
jgi:hypothetical protein